MTAQMLSLDTNACVEAAFAIGAHLSRSAILHENRCTWITPVATLDRSQPVNASCGPDLHGGTSGIALFLAALARATRERFIERTALAATRHALASAESILPLGLYGGTAGVAYAAVRIGELLGQNEFLERGLALLSRLPVSAGAHDTDLVSGIAGSLLAFLAGYRASGDTRLLDAAQRCAHELATGAVRDGELVSWATMTEIARNLTGFAHGAAGIAYALCALHAVAPDATVRELAVGAIAYEEHVFDPATGNWPDFRNFARTANGTFVGSTAWCHGAPGIARSRDLAHAVLGDAAYAEQAQRARATTASIVERMLTNAETDYTLCHGLTGLAEILAADPSGNAAWQDLVATVAANGIERHHREERPWPCGIPGRGEAPGLMAGLAGIGYFFLRRSDGDLPDLLAIAG